MTTHDRPVEVPLRGAELMMVAGPMRLGRGLGLRTRSAVLELCERLLSFDGGMHTARRNAWDASCDDRRRARHRAEAARALAGAAALGAAAAHGVDAAAGAEPASARMA